MMRYLQKYGIVILCLCVVTAAGAKTAFSVETGVRETDVNGEAVEKHLPVDQSITPWIHDPAIFEKDEGDRTEMRKVVEQNFKTIKLHNLVPPIHFGLGEVEITEDYLKLLRNVLDSMRDRTNVRLHFVGHADSS
jgi:outer membrane protein OmpA-like peptidoglycan-associated protein